MNRLLIIFLAAVTTFSASCSGSADIAMGGDYVITVEPGEEWLHDFSKLIKNAPQYALWMEDSSGEYLGTVFLTRKTATEGWIFNKGNRRIEALPVWAHRRNIEDESGVLYPSKDEALSDGISGATPKEGSEIIISPLDSHSGFRLLMEVNHSTDFNDFWPKDALSGEADWTGGMEGSGQPSLVYSTWIDPDENGPWQLTLAGHGSPDGSDGLISADVSSCSTALQIMESIYVSEIP